MKTVPNYPVGKDLLAGKTVLVTAAAGTGIGYATAQRCAEEGCKKLVISDIHERRLNEAAERIEAATGMKPGQVLCNVTKEEDVQNLFAQAIEQMGHIDVLMNNAGLGGTKDVAEMTDDEWNIVLDVTLTGTFRCTRAALKHMYARKAGAIVNNASVLGWRAQKGQAHYAAAKAGVMAFTRCSAVEAADHNVRINAIAPSLAKHPFLVKVTTKELLDELEAKEAYGRGAEPWEMANIMIFLASDYATYLTGEVISASSQHA